MHGAFRRGATVLRTPEGVVYRRLAVRGDELRLANRGFEARGRGSGLRQLNSDVRNDLSGDRLVLNSED
jgi:hypothetical protein